MCYLAGMQLKSWKSHITSDVLTAKTGHHTGSCSGLHVPASIGQTRVGSLTDCHSCLQACCCLLRVWSTFLICCLDLLHAVLNSVFHLCESVQILTRASALQMQLVWFSQPAVLSTCAFCPIAACAFVILPTAFCLTQLPVSFCPLTQHVACYLMKPSLCLLTSLDSSHMGHMCPCWPTAGHCHQSHVILSWTMLTACLL